MRQATLASELRRWTRDWVLLAPLPTTISIAIGFIAFDDFSLSMPLVIGSLLSYSIGVMFTYLDDLDFAAWRRQPNAFWPTMGTLLPTARLVTSFFALIFLVVVVIEPYMNADYNQKQVFLAAVVLAAFASVASLAAVFLRRTSQMESV